MPDEIIYQDVLSTVEEKGLSVEQTQLYLIENIERESIFAEVEGLYLPRELTGLVRETEDDREEKRRYTHELGHGVFCENLVPGQKLVELDSKVADLEKKLYGKYPKEKFVSLPTNTDQTLRVDREEAEEIAGKELEDAENYYLVDKELFDEYVESRSHLNSFFKQNTDIFEGFTLLLEEEIFGEIPNMEERPEFHRKAYSRVKNIGLEELSSQLEPK